MENFPYPLSVRMSTAAVALVYLALIAGVSTAAAAPAAEDDRESTTPHHDPATPEDAAIESDGGLLGSGAWGAVGALVGAGAGWALGRRRRTVRARPEAADARTSAAVGARDAGAAARVEVVAQSAPAGNLGESPDSAATDRLVDELVEGLMASHDLASSDGQRSRLAATLRRAGVVMLAPESGALFDPERHHALASEPAPSPEHRERIARVERPGWARSGQVLRYPEIVVWQ